MMFSNTVNRIYFSRYFYSVFKSKISVYCNSWDYSNSFYFSNIYYYKKLVNKFSNLPNKNSFFISSFFQNYVFPISFKMSFFDYDFSWNPYKANKDIFKNIFVSFIRIKLSLPFSVKIYKIFIFYFLNFKIK